MARISNNTVLKEILQEIKEIKAILHRPLSNYAVGEEKTPEIPKRQCQKCGNEIIENKGIMDVETFYCLPCWKVKMEKELIAEVQQERKEKVGLHGIPEIMGGVMETQKKHVERMKEAEKTEQPNSFKQFAEGMNKVECVECKSGMSLAECNYDPARNRYTCHPCDKKLKEAERAKKEAETQDKIKELHGGIK